MFCTVGMPLGEFVAFTHSAWRTRSLIGKAEHIKRKTIRIRRWEGKLHHSMEALQQTAREADCTMGGRNSH